MWLSCEQILFLLKQIKNQNRILFFTGGKNTICVELCSYNAVSWSLSLDYTFVQLDVW